MSMTIKAFPQINVTVACRCFIESERAREMERVRDLLESLGICIRKQLSCGLIFYVCRLLQRSVSCMLNSKEHRVVATALTRRCTAGEKNSGRTLSAGKYGENENEASRNLRMPLCNLGAGKKKKINRCFCITTRGPGSTLQ